MGLNQGNAGSFEEMAKEMEANENTSETVAETTEDSVEETTDDNVESETE